MEFLKRIKRRPEFVPAVLSGIALLLMCILSFVPPLMEYEIGEIGVGLFINYLLFIVTLSTILFISKKAYKRGASLMTLLLSPVVCFFIVDGLNAVNIFVYDFYTGAINYLVYFVIHLFVLVLTSRVRVAVIATNTLAFIFGIVNHFVQAFRGTPLLPWDLASAKTAMSVLPNYQLQLPVNVLGSVILFLLMLWIGIRIQYVMHEMNTSILRIICTRAITLFIIGGFFYSVIFTSIPAALGIEPYPWRQNAAAKSNGALTNFIVNLQYFIIAEPDGYSAKTAKEIATQYESSFEPNVTNATKPDNIIVIMNETFADLKTIVDFKTNEDYMPFTREVMASDDTISGHALVSAFAGSTANSEFEALTGSSTAFLPAGSIPYQQYLNHPMDSLVSLLKKDNFSATSFHPFESEGWNRNIVYPLLGFERSLWATDVVRPKLVRDYISDESNYDKVIEEYENSPEGKPNFIFNVTMQNHSGYRDLTYPSTIRLQGMDVIYPQVEQYLSLIKEADTALKGLIEYFENEEENTLILFFGDHFPGVGDDFYEELYGKSLDDLTLEETQKQYQVPYFIWGNYDLPEIEYGDVSSSYLSSMLLEVGGFELPAYQKFLLELQKTVPQMNQKGYLGDDGVWRSYDESGPYDEIINEYRILQYNNLLDKKNRDESIFQ